MQYRVIATFLIILVMVGACRKRPDEVSTQQQTKLTITFDNRVNEQPLILETGQYVNAHGDSFTVSAYMYYISNVSLVSSDGVEYIEPESYHLINQEDNNSKLIELKDLPKAKYTKLRFLIGVDSTRNVSGAQTGALAPENNMFWSWKTGYIMAKMEGLSSVAPDNHLLGLHIAGFAGTTSVLRWVTLDLPQPAEVKDDNIPNIHLVSDLAEWFKGPVVIDFSKTYSIGLVGPEAVEIADNYADMFHVDHVD